MSRRKKPASTSASRQVSMIRRRRSLLPALEDGALSPMSLAEVPDAAVGLLREVFIL